MESFISISDTYIFIPRVYLYLEEIQNLNVVWSLEMQNLDKNIVYCLGSRSMSGSSPRNSKAEHFYNHLRISTNVMKNSKERTVIDWIAG